MENKAQQQKEREKTSEWPQIKSLLSQDEVGMFISWKDCKGSLIN